MPRTQIGTRILRDGDVRREDLNTTIAGDAVVTNLKEGEGIELQSTGAESGTGEVTIVNLPFGTRVSFPYSSNQLIYENPTLQLWWIASNRQFAFVNKTSGYHTYSVYTMYDTTRKRRVRSVNKSANSLTYLSNNGNSQNNWGFPNNEENGSSTFMIAKDDQSADVIRGEALRHFNTITVIVWRMS